LVAVSPQLVKYNKAMKEEKNLSFVILSDPGNQIAERYGIKYQMPEDLIKIYRQFGLKVDEHNGDGSWTLPMPARLIIDQYGIIRYAEINPDYTERPEPEDTLTAFREITR
jgi:peroxiredoxin